MINNLIYFNADTLKKEKNYVVINNDFLILFSGDCDLCVSLVGLKTTTTKKRLISTEVPY